MSREERKEDKLNQVYKQPPKHRTTYTNESKNSQKKITV